MSQNNSNSNNDSRMPRAGTGTGTGIPFARPLHHFTQVELFDELSRVEQLVENLNTTIDKLLDSGELGCTADLLLASSIQKYKIKREGYIARIRAHILATRR